MKISELKPKQGSVNIKGIIKEIEEPRVFNKFGRNMSVANAIFEDDSGFVKLTLWNDDIKRFKPGDTIKITNGFVNEFQGEKQLTSGKFGKMEKITKDAMVAGEEAVEEIVEEVEEEDY